MNSLLLEKYISQHFISDPKGEVHEEDFTYEKYIQTEKHVHKRIYDFLMSIKEPVQNHNIQLLL